MNSLFIWKPEWDSLRRVLLKLPLLGHGHPLLGRCAPSGWPNNPRDSAVTTSTSTFLRDLWATHPLTHRVCSRGQIGGKWGRPRTVGEFVLLVVWGHLPGSTVTCVGDRCARQRRLKRRRALEAGSLSTSKWYRVVIAVFSAVTILKWNDCRYSFHNVQSAHVVWNSTRRKCCSFRLIIRCTYGDYKSNTFVWGVILDWCSWWLWKMDFCARGTESGKSDITTSPWIAVSILSSLSACTIYHIKKCYIQYQGMNLLKHLMRETKAMCPIVIHGSRVWGDEIITTVSGCPSVWMSSVWIQYSLFVAVLVAHTASFLWDSLWLQPLACTSIVGPHSYPRYAFLIGPKRFFLLYIFSLQYYE